MYTRPLRSVEKYSNISIKLYTLWENARLQAWGCPKQGFHDVIKTKYGWISHNHVSCESHAIESGFITKIKQNINIFTDFEISHLKNQSLWIN